jgi:hypothetical protein
MAHDPIAWPTHSTSHLGKMPREIFATFATADENASYRSALDIATSLKVRNRMLEVEWSPEVSCQSFTREV